MLTYELEPLKGCGRTDARSWSFTTSNLRNHKQPTKVNHTISNDQRQDIVEDIVDSVSVNQTLPRDWLGCNIQPNVYFVSLGTIRPICIKVTTLALEIRVVLLIESWEASQSKGAQQKKIFMPLAISSHQSSRFPSGYFDEELDEYQVGWRDTSSPQTTLGWFSSLSPR